MIIFYQKWQITQIETISKTEGIFIGPRNPLYIWMTGTKNSGSQKMINLYLRFAKWLLPLKIFLFYPLSLDDKQLFLGELWHKKIKWTLLQCISVIFNNRSHASLLEIHVFHYSQIPYDVFFFSWGLWRIKHTTKVNSCICFVSLGGKGEFSGVTLWLQKHLLQTDQTSGRHVLSNLEYEQSKKTWNK